MSQPMLSSTSPYLISRSVARRERMTRMSNATKAFNGDFDAPLDIGDDGIDDNVYLNMAKVICDKDESFLAGKPIVVSLDDNDSVESPTEKKLRDWLRLRRFNTFFRNFVQLGGITGHGFIQILPSKSKIGPRIVMVNPMYVDVIYSADDKDTVQAYIIEYQTVEPLTGRPQIYRKTIARGDNPSVAQYQFEPTVSPGPPDELDDDDADDQDAGPAHELPDHWLIVEQTRYGELMSSLYSDTIDAGAWETTTTIKWAKSWPPIIDCQNEPNPFDFWGRPTLGSDIIRLNNSLNFLASNLNRIVRLHAHPKFWSNGVIGDQIDFSVDALIQIQSNETSLNMLEMTASGLAPALELYKVMKDMLHELSRTPEIATGNMEHVSRLSGVAIAMLYEPIVEKTESKRGLYGDMLIELFRRILELMGEGEDNAVTIHWPALLPKDDFTSREAWAIDRQLGIVSKATLAEMAGYDWAHEEAQIDAEDKALAAKRDTLGVNAGEPLDTPDFGLAPKATPNGPGGTNSGTAAKPKAQTPKPKAKAAA